MTEGAEQPSSSGDLRTCYGVLFFSSARYEAGKLPRCAGFNRTGADFPASHSPDSLPGGDFKYLCAGCSRYSPSRYAELRAAAKSSAGSVELPLCEGVEIISAAEFQPGAVPLGTEAAAGDAAAAQPGPPSMQPKPGRVFDERAGGWGGAPWQAPSGLTFSTFLEQLQKNAEKVGTQLVRNVGLIGNSMVNAAKQTSDELRRRGGQ